MTPSFQSRLYKMLLRRMVRPALYPGVDMPAVRRRMEKADALSRLGERGFDREAVSAGGVPAEWIRTPGADPDVVFLYFHGGGFCLRTPGMHGQLVARICQGSGITGLMPDYRLAPEHPFPAAFEDGLAVYRWLLDEGVAPEKIVIGGDSAGGELTLGTLLQARQAGLPMPACAVLLSPGIDALHRPDISGLKAGASLSPGSIIAFRESFQAHKQPNHPILKLMAGSLVGLPPLLFQVGTDELLFDEVTAAAKRAKADGVPTTLEIYDDMPHVFQVSASLPESKRAVGKIVGFIERNLLK
ncbi:MAG TPA: alpha/beta hydrolase [Anaerolineales bacterium]|nr:alpha/beta hydrolase [Anaerolineales bacterium]